jgi:hypothetical protein
MSGEHSAHAISAPIPSGYYTYLRIIIAQIPWKFKTQNKKRHTPGQKNTNQIQPTAAQSNKSSTTAPSMTFFSKNT